MTPRRLLTTAVLAAVLVLLTAAPAAAWPRGVTDRADSVIVVGVSGLLWDDVTTGDTPTLARLAGSGSVGTLSVRAAPAVTCPGEGWLTLGAGRSAAVVDLAHVDTDAGCGPRTAPPVDTRGGHATIAGWDQIVDVNHDLRFGADPGILGDRTRCATAVGPGAALAAADTSGTVAVYRPTLPDEPGTLLDACPLTAVDLGGLPPGNARAAALRQMDDALARIDRTRPAGSLLLVVGVSDTDARQGRLHVAVADGPGFHGGWLRSPSTGRTPYLQLVDVAPTVLAALDLPVPDDEVAGQPLMRAGGDRPGSFAATRARLVDANTAAVERKRLVGPVLAGFAVVCVLVYGAAVLVLRRRPPGDPWRSRASIAVTALGAVPAATFLANTVPWWRAPTPWAVTAALVGALVAWTAVVTALAVATPWGRTATGRLAIVAGATALVLLGDVATGARLQLNSLLGYTALEAGRFVGFGNVAFAVLGAAALMLAAVLAAGRPARVAVAVVAVVAVPVIVVEGSPGFGTDFGGILTLVPAFGVLALLVAGRRVTTGRAIAVLGAGAGVVATAAIGDYLRPAQDRTHFGRFVATVLDGGFFSTVDRKVRANLDLLFAGPHTVAAAILLVLAAWAVFRPPAALRTAYAAHPGLRIGLRVVVVLGALGFAVNDSGIAIPTNAALIALPAALAACLRPEPAARAASMVSGSTSAEASSGAGTTTAGDVTGTDETTDGEAGGAEGGPDTPSRETGAPADVLP